MISKRLNPVYAALLLALFGSAPLAAANFVYEGQLDDRGAPAEGRYDIQLEVYRDAEFGATVNAPVVFSAVEVRDGRFRLDFEAKLDDGEPAWVGLALRDVGASLFSAIPGRTKAIQAPAAIGACWSTVGDSGSNPATHFLGTTDAQPLVLRTANAQSLRIEPSSITSGTPALPITTNMIGGSRSNAVSAGVRGATVSGGGATSGGDPSYIVGGNSVTDNYGVVGGGASNRAGDGAGDFSDGSFATVGGGDGNQASGYLSTVVGGFVNTASGTHSAVGGGSYNSSLGAGSAVVGGDANLASGVASTVGGGERNCAGGDHSWAGGYRAKVRPGLDPGAGGGACTGLISYPGGSGDRGSFTWADSQATDFISTGDNQFLVRAAGGMAVNANDPQGSALRVNGTIRVDTLGTFSAGASPLCRNIGNQISLCASSKRYKDDIADLPPSLDAVLALRPVSYRWKVTGAADLGFVAEEVAELDQRLITRNDAGEIEGVKYERMSALLASAVQEMAAREQLQADEIAQLRKELASLRQLIVTQRAGGR